MDNEKRNRLIEEAVNHYATLKQQFCRPIFEIMCRALLKAQATLEEIGLNRDERDRILDIMAMLAPSCCPTENQLFRQITLNEIRLLLAEQRQNPILKTIYRITGILSIFKATGLEVGSSFTEFSDLMRRAYLKEIKCAGQKQDHEALSRMLKELHDCIDDDAIDLSILDELTGEILEQSLAINHGSDKTDPHSLN